MNDDEVTRPYRCENRIMAWDRGRDYSLRLVPPDVVYDDPQRWLAFDLDIARVFEALRVQEGA